MFHPFPSLFPARAASFPVSSLHVARNKLTNQKRFYCFNHKPIRADFLTQFERGLLAVRHAQKRTALGSRMVVATSRYTRVLRMPATVFK